MQEQCRKDESGEMIPAERGNDHREGNGGEAMNDQKGREPEGKAMIHFEDAYRIVMGSVIELGTETVPLLKACGRVLGVDAVSDIDMPPFDKSAMDGRGPR